MRPFDSIILTEDISETVSSGMTGVIVDQFENAPDLFMVEVFDHDGNTVDVVEVENGQMYITLSDFFPTERVVLLDDLPSLLRGQVGMIRERVGVGLYRVDFLDYHDRPTTVSHILHAGQLMLLRWQPTVATSKTIDTHTTPIAP